MAAILPPRGACFRTPPNLSSTFRPGSILTHIRCRVCPLRFLRACPIGPLSEQLADAAATAYGAPSAAYVAPAPGTQILLPLVCGLVRPGRRRDPDAHLFRARARRRARRPCRYRSPRSRRDRQLPTSLLSPIPTIRTAGCSPKTICWPSPRRSARAVACSWSTRPSWMSGRAARASLRRLAAATSWCCARSANSSGSPGCGSALRWPRRRLPRGLSALLGPWAVSGPALAVGAAALADRDWIEETRRGLAEAAARLDAILNGAGLDIVGGTTLFRLTRTRRGQRIVPSSRPRRHSDARFPRSRHVAALWPAGRRAGLAALADCDGRVSRQPLGFER